MCLRRGSGVATGRAWTILLAAAPTSSGGLKRTFSSVLHGLGRLAKPGAKRQTQETVAGWPDLDRDFAEEPGLIPYLSAILSPIRGTPGRLPCVSHGSPGLRWSVWLMQLGILCPWLRLPGQSCPKVRRLGPARKMAGECACQCARGGRAPLKLEGEDQPRVCSNPISVR